MANKNFSRFGRAHLYRIGVTTISGVVRELTTPVSRQVVLLEQNSLRPLRETRSASNGTYSFPNMEENQEYLVMAFDHNGAYNAVIADRVAT